MISPNEDDSKRRRSKWKLRKKRLLLQGIMIIIVLLWMRSQFSTTIVQQQQQKQKHLQSNNHLLPDPPSSSSNNLITKIACVGDSLTRGDIGVQNGRDDYPSQLQNMLDNDNNGRHYKVRNFGINGAMALRGRQASYNITNIFKRSLEFQPDVVLIMLGTNDAKVVLGQPEEQLVLFEQDYEWIVRQYDGDDDSNSRSSSTKTIIAVPPWVKQDFGKIRDEVMEKSIVPSIRNVAKRFDTPHRVVDMRAITYGNSSLFVGDGLHLNALGYKVVAEAWKNAILTHA